MKAEVYSKEGIALGRTIELPDDIFGVTPNEHVVYLSVKQYLASRRSGTHKTKERNEVAGSTRKLHKQKGTGGARKGSIRNPLYKGGGRIFGPEPRDYGFKLNKKEKSLAKKSALSSKLSIDGIRVVEDFSFEGPKTKDYLNILKGFGLEGKKSLLVTPEFMESVYISGRNIPHAEYTVVDSLSPYEILRANTVLLSEKSVEAIKEQLS